MQIGQRWRKRIARSLKTFGSTSGISCEKLFPKTQFLSKSSHGHLECSFDGTFAKLQLKIQKTAQFRNFK